MSEEQAIYPLMSITKFPSAPALWSSSDPGELWIWGDYFFTLQKEPKTALDMLSQQMKGQSLETGMTYRYAMNVFYQLDKNPHGPSHRPIMAICLEQSDYDQAMKFFRDGTVTIILPENSDANLGPIFLALFTAEMRLNFGEYEGELSHEAVRDAFFQVLSKQLKLSGEPKHAGVMEDAFGHPETGLPAKKKKMGCGLVVLLGVSLTGLGISTLLL
ncbi:MAG: hypothetical protein Q4G44_02465 [Alcaligenaceae bacterium]|nr:hypothetical protein [Alcaligenaceae bacterium]